MRAKLRSHQTEGYEAVSSALQKYGRATAVMACGSGKTLLGLRVAEGQARILILEPSLALIRHALKHAGEDGLLSDRRVVCVCSDKTVADRDEWSVSESELGVPVTTDAIGLRKLLEQASSRCVVFCTYHSQALLQSALPFGYEFDFGIFDEAHRTAGARDRAFSVALNDAQIPITKRLFLTATPRLILEDKEEYRKAAYSMDDESTYGPIAFELNLPEAIRRDIVCDIEVLVSSATSAEVRTTLQRARHFLMPHKRVPVELVAGQIAVVRAMEATGARRVISFHQTIVQAAAFAKDRLKIYQSAGVIPFHIRGDMPDSQRMAVIEAFLSVDRPSLLTNCRCLSEGVDVPDIDMVTFMGRKESLIDVVQAMGRASRKREGKSRGYVMLPLYVNQDEPLEAALERSDMSVTWEILHSVLESDGILTNRLTRAQSSSQLPSGNDRGRVPQRLRIVGPEGLLADLERAISIRRVKRLSQRWDVMFRAAEHYAARMGNMAVPLEHLEDDLPLGRWLVKQKYLRKHGRLAGDRADRLLALGAWPPRSKSSSSSRALSKKGWSRGAVWEKNLARARAFLEQNGHLDIPTTDGYASLHTWMARARRSLLMDHLPHGKRSELLALGVKPAVSKTHQGMIERLAKWRATNPIGRPKRTGLDAELAYSLAYLREKYRSGKVLDSDLESLAAIDLDPRTFHSRGKTTYQQFGEKSWDLHYKKLKAYTERQGWTGLWNSGRIDGLNVEGWVVYQRHLKRKGALSAERVGALEELGIQWDRKTEWWVNWVEQLESFYREHNHLRLPTVPEFAALQRKVTEFRNRLQNGTLAPEIQLRLNAIEFPRTKEEAYRQWGIRLLKDWCLTHGRNASAQAELPSRLRFFLGNMRRRFMKKQLSDSEVSQLAALGVSWTYCDSTDVTMISRLVAIKKKLGKANVEIMAQQEPDLHTWIEGQLQKAARSELPPDFLAKLRNVGLEVSDFENLSALASNA